MYESQNTTRTSGNGIKTDTDKTATNKNALMKLKSYLIALRVWSLSASIIPTILGKSEKQETWTKNIVQQVPWHSPWRSQKKNTFLSLCAQKVPRPNWIFGQDNRLACDFLNL